MKFITGWALFLVASVAAAVDDNDSYAVKGAGTSFCSAFVDTVDSKDRKYLVYGGWIEGYITALNQQLEQTYDLAPWQSTELLLSFMQSSCRANPDVQFHEMAKAMTAELARVKLKQGGRYVLIKGSDNLVLHEEIVRRAKSVLGAKGLYSGDTQKVNWDEDVRAAMKLFQESAKLPASGLPDQASLFWLFK